MQYRKVCEPSGRSSSNIASRVGILRGGVVDLGGGVFALGGGVVDLVLL